jgi:glutamate racemase
MIGVFDSGLGGLTVLRALSARFPAQSFLYLGDHAHAPYGDRASAEIVELTRAGVARLFAAGARLVVLGCNTATAVALRTLQREWLARSELAGRCNVLGIVAPTVEAATQTPWAVTKPQYPQKNNREAIAVFGTTRTIESGVYPEEIRKRCPRVRVVQQACSGLAAAIEQARPQAELDAIVADSVAALLAQLAAAESARSRGPQQPDRAILGCTHFSLVENLFADNLPAGVRILSQPEIVADSLEDYLARHPEYAGRAGVGVRLITTGEPDAVSRAAAVFWPGAPRFERA